MATYPSSVGVSEVKSERTITYFKPRTNVNITH